MCLINLKCFEQVRLIYNKAIRIYGSENKNIIPLKNIFNGSIVLPEGHKGVVLLTTYSHQDSQNVGDKLITYSFLNMQKILVMR